MSREVAEMFDDDHLAAHLQEVAKPYAAMAKLAVETLPDASRHFIVLRALLEARDGAVSKAQKARAEERAKQGSMEMAAGFLAQLRGDGAAPAESANNRPNPAATPLADLGFSTRVQTVLARLGLQRVADLLLVSERQLMRQRDFGRTSLAEVRSKLAVLGLQLSVTDHDATRQRNLIAASQPDRARDRALIQMGVQSGDARVFEDLVFCDSLIDAVDQKPD